MALLDPLFGSEATTAIFSEHQTLQRMLDVEAALARAEARVGVIPLAAVRPIESKCKAELFDRRALAESAATAGNLAIPLVKELTTKVSEIDENAARYVHWGVTSQDIIDTALVLQLKDALAAIQGDLTTLCGKLCRLADKHRSTPCVARTWMQQAVPTVLGLKFAGWLDALIGHKSRIRTARREVSVLQFGGSAGTLASLGSQGLNVATVLAEELRLELPTLPWHAHRDRFAQVATALALMTGTLGKIARDTALLSQTEVAEMSEPHQAGRGGSSAMPQKRNPVDSAIVLAAALRVPALTSVMLNAMVQEYERGLGGWHAEWETLPEIVRLSAGALRRISQTMVGLNIDVDRMRRNLDETHGLIFAEAVTMKLGEQLGRSQAHSALQAASERVMHEGKGLRAVLMEDPQIAGRLTADEMDAVFDPRQYTGAAEQFIDRVISAERQSTLKEDT